MEATFDWRSLGKADYSQAAALVASLPEEVRCKLDGASREILTRITYLSWSYAARSGRGRGYAIPSQAYLSKASGRSPRTVRRCITKLRALGLLMWIRRKDSSNSWTSNLYQVGKTFLASLFARGRKKIQQNHQRTFLADNDLKREYKAGANSERAPRPVKIDVKETPVTDSPLGAESRNRLRQLIEEFGSKVTSGGPESWDEPEPAGEVVVSVADRKAQLREQARALLERGL